LKNPIAGKTGTTQNNSDGWFIGMTPELAAGCWVGGEDRAVHFNTTDQGQGASMALPIWGKFFQKVYADKTIKISKGDFIRPARMSEIELDCSKYDTENQPPPEDPDNPFDL
jgi:penicillin-binding protein 1A